VQLILKARLHLKASLARFELRNLWF